jgi:hypothetical protein
MNVIEGLFSSPALYRTPALFFEYPSEPLNPRLISRYAGIDINSVVRALKKLEKRDHRKFSFLDPACMVWDGSSDG